jgi:hypothetical protein
MKLSRATGLRMPATMWVMSLVFVFFAVGVSAQESALVEPTETQRGYAERAVELIGSGEFERAAGLFRSSLALGELNVTYLNLGRTLQKLRRCSDAEEAYSKVDSAPVVPSPTRQEVTTVLRRYQTELGKSCNAVLTVTCADERTQISVDGGNAKSCMQPFSVMKGSHEVVATLGKRSKSYSVRVVHKSVAQLHVDLSKERALETTKPTSPQPGLGVESEAAAQQGVPGVRWGWYVAGAGVGLMAFATMWDWAQVQSAHEGMRDARTREVYEAR